MRGLVLSPGRDPWSNFSALQRSRAEWVAQMFGRMGKHAHLRALHYFCVSQKPAARWPDGEVYANTESHWERLCMSAVHARYLGLGEWSNLVDRKHPEPADSTDYDAYNPDPRFDQVQFSTDGLKNTLLRGAPRFSTTGLSNYFLGVIVEKATMNEALVPAIRRYGAVLQSLVGESSVERVAGMVERIHRANKPARLFYISDFDPSGAAMPVSFARKLEFYASQHDLDIRLQPLALTAEQVAHYRLPGIPTKASDSRAAGFVERFGDRATELDALEALHPGVLRRLVAEALAPYVDEPKVKAVEEINAHLRKAFGDLIDANHATILESLADDLNQTAQEEHTLALDLTEGIDYPNADHVASESDDWLLDTQRPYDDQIAAYRTYRGKG